MEIKKEDLEKLKKYGPAVALLVVLGLAFFWFQIRPAQITKACSKSSVEKAIKQRQLRIGNDNHEEKFSENDYEFYYQKCLRDEGLKK